MGKYLKLVVMLMITASCSGCALLQIPMTLLGWAMKIASAMPKPPPGVFF